MLSIHPPTGKPVWIDLREPTPEELAKACNDFALPIPTRDRLEEIEFSSRLHAENNMIILSVPVSPHIKGQEPLTTPVGFVLTPDVLATVRFARLNTFAPIAERVDRHPASAAKVFITLIETIVDYSADRLEEIKAATVAISKRVFSDGAKQNNVSRTNKMLRQTLIEIGEMGEQLSEIRDTLLVLQRISPFVIENGAGWIGAEIKARLKVAANDIQSLNDFEVHLTDKVQLLLDATVGFINTEQNDLFKVLTIASVVGIPPTFIASMYGMNFHNIPEYGWAYGYQWGLGLIVLSTILPIVWFKWRGWW
jgi:magnesium transporter